LRERLVAKRKPTRGQYSPIKLSPKALEPSIVDQYRSGIAQHTSKLEEFESSHDQLSQTEVGQIKFAQLLHDIVKRVP